MQSSLMKSGSTNANASEANDQVIIQKAVPALKRLADLADNAPNNDALGNIIKRFLLSMYNGEFYPLDVGLLRNLKQDTFEDCLVVLMLNCRVDRHNHMRTEIQYYLDDGFQRFERWAEAPRLGTATSKGVAFR
jgi:hypothetical protein